MKFGIGDRIFPRYIKNRANSRDNNNNTSSSLGFKKRDAHGTWQKQLFLCPGQQFLSFSLSSQTSFSRTSYKGGYWFFKDFAFPKINPWGGRLLGRVSWIYNPTVWYFIPIPESPDLSFSSSVMFRHFKNRMLLECCLLTWKTSEVLG